MSKDKKNSVTKLEMAQRLVDKNPGITQPTAHSIVDDFFKMIGESAANGRDVDIRGFGRFEAVIRKAKTGRNITDNSVVPIPACRTIVFKPYDKMKDLMMQGFDETN